MLESLIRPRTLRRALTLLAFLAAAASLTSRGAVDAQAATFTRGFADSVYVWPDNASQSSQEWAQNVHASGGRVAEVEVDWNRYEPNAPTAGDSTNPSNPAYSGWLILDQTVKSLVAAGVQPMLLVTDAPAWAQGSGCAGATTEGCEPNDSALQGFAQALATRYDGSFPDPSSPGTDLPAVKYYQDWAEANLTIKLAPEWTKVGHAWVDTGATIYRNMLNAFYAGVKAAEPGDLVIFSGLESYGDPPGTANARVAPVTFLEDVLCLNRSLERVCNTPAHFDVMASDPYDVGSPTTHAVSPRDASAPDLGRLMKVVKAALAEGTALPDVKKPLWVTEFSYDSNPPNPAGLPIQKQARTLELSLYTFWNEGVSTVLWYLIRDQAGTDYAVDYFSGIYFYNGKKKPSYTAYNFPLVVAPSGTRSRFWGIAPGAGEVTIERKVGSGWTRVASFRRTAGAVFTGLMARRSHGSYRAVEGKQKSLVWTF